MLIARIYILSDSSHWKMTTLYRLQKSINKGNKQVNGSSLKFTYFCPNSCLRSYLCVLFIQCKMQILFLKWPLMLYRDSEKNKIISLANQNDSPPKFWDQCEDDVMTYLTPFAHRQRLWTPLSPSKISNPRPGLTPGTALRAVGSGITLKIFKWSVLRTTLISIFFECTSMRFDKYSQALNHKQGVNCVVTSDHNPDHGFQTF